MKTLKLFFILLIQTTSFTTTFAGTPEEVIISSTDINNALDAGTFRKLNISNINSFYLEDMDKNGKTDIIAYTSGNFKYISIRTPDNLSIGEIPLSETPKGSFFCQDINNDSIPEIIYLSEQNENVFLNIYNPVNHQINKESIFKGQDCFPDGIFDVNLYDVKVLEHSNGDSLLLVEVSTGHDQQPRGILAFSLPEFDLVWDFLIGATILGPMLLHDINDDGRPEILFSTTASANGVNLNGYSDNKSYFVILTENGNELFKYEYSGPLSYCNFNLILPEKDILLYGYTNHERSNQPDIILLEGKSFQEKYRYHTVYKRSHDGGLRSEIINHRKDLITFKDNHNAMYLLDRQLQVTKRIRFPQPVRRIYDYQNNKDGLPAFLIILQNISEKTSIFLLLDNSMNIISKNIFPVQSPESIKLNVTNEGKAFYFIDQANLSIYEWFIPETQLNPSFNFNQFALRHSKFIWIIVIILLLLLISSIIINIFNRKNLNLQKYKTLSDYFMNNPFEAIILVNEDGKINRFNRAFRDIFAQIQPENYINHSIESLIKSLNQPTLWIKIKNALESRENHFNQMQELDLNIEGNLLKIKTVLQKLYLNKDHFTLVIKFTDLTKAIRHDRISNWAALAQKLAHEIKNPLMSMTLSLGRLQKKFSEEKITEPNKKYFEFIREDIERMRDSSNEFMRFTSSIQLKPEYCQLNDIITEIVKKFKLTFSDRIMISAELVKTSPDVFIDIEQTTQILKYIIDNGVDAIEGTGAIQVKTGVVEKLSTENSHTDHFVQVMITDNGTGIAKDNLGRIFEPSFTTKKTGSGFGLAIARQVIEDQGGNISISSKNEVGTIVTIEFPVKGKYITK